ncbi:MAG: trigger factor [Bacteroidetes bacterium]|nr:trigger factor [Bacteroidota bacterium]
MATVTRENISLLNDKITVKVAKDDYLPSFEKALKEYSKKANIPGFRKGMVPVGMIKKMYGNSVLTDEVLRTVEKELTNYMTSEKLDIFAQPLPLPENDARQIDVSSPAEYAFAFEVGLKPEFTIADLAKAKLTRYKIEVTDQMVNDEVERLQIRNGKMTDPESVTGDDNVINITFTESDADGNAIEGGISKDNSLLVKYFNENFRKNWIGKKKDDFVVLQLATAFDEKEREWIISDLGLDKEDKTATEKYFKVTITKVGLVERAELNEEFFKTVYPKKEIKTEEEFKAAIKEEINNYWDAQTRSQLHHSLYHEILDHTNIDFPESFLKRWIQSSGEQPKSAEEAEHEFPVFANQLKWTLIVNKVVTENNIEVTADDIKASAKQQLLSYMQGQVMDEEQPWITDYVNRMMQDRKFVEETMHRIQTDKVFAWTETQIKPTEKTITAEEFNKMQQEHQHHHH